MQENGNEAYHYSDQGDYRWHERPFRNTFGEAARELRGIYILLTAWDQYPAIPVIISKEQDIGKKGTGDPVTPVLTMGAPGPVPRR